MPGHGAKWTFPVGNGPNALLTYIKRLFARLKIMQAMESGGSTMRNTLQALARMAGAAAILVLGAVMTADLVNAQPAQSERSGEDIVKSQCAQCHQSGKDGAPKIDDRAAWAPRMKQGLTATVRSAMKGHGKMPARGGLAEITDSELRAAILYMFYPAAASIRAAPAAAPEAADPHHKVVAGMDVYLGIVPAQAAGVKMAKPSGTDYYFINITLRDRASGSAIKDAKVQARASNAVSGGETKQLEPAETNDAPSYGNFFRMRGKEPYAITVKISRSAKAMPSEARFEFKP